MSYLVFLLCLCLVFGLVLVAANPSPYFGAAGLMLSAAVGCMVLVEFGGSFVSLVLFLIYLGGMLVVFAYSVALASDYYPETWGNWFVGAYLGGYLLLLMVMWEELGKGEFSVFGVGGGDALGMFVLRGDIVGVSLLYSVGGGMLLIGGYSLLLTLFVVLELTRGHVRGGLRVV
uniref:NADH-ubiquinone oxidoreductase chain 6 n=1 Tax=Polychrus marmoratus TaxID=38934 RepID=C4T8F9_POLMR|nr:NADH dehydrogenase subunit 6 [Polychrus marmoratus]BAH70471.1 NADH dehydrogenase subunit 6 [Polychrus marmoratus]